MLEKVKKAHDGLVAISDGIEELPGQTELLSPAQGWTYPALTPSHVSWMAMSLAKTLEAGNFENLNDHENGIIADINKSVRYILDSVMPNLPGNPAAGIQSIAITLSALNAEISPLLVWGRAEKSHLPNSLLRRLHQVQRDIDILTPDKEKLAVDIKLIADATEAAEALPSTLQELRASQAELREISSAASQVIGKIDELHRAANEHVVMSRKSAEESEQLLKMASEAYRVTTTIGLAAAFDERARKLNTSVYIWVCGLALSLITLLVIGWIRLEDMRESFAATAFDPTRVWTQVALSVLSVGAPIWFAWLSTKQIGQRFRLAEDYAFKASVSKAYEGYRREARELSSEFSQSLFGSALKRLDEAPLRLLDTPTPGSPINEALDSEAIKGLLDRAKDLMTRPSLKKVPAADKEQ